MTKCANCLPIFDCSADCQWDDEKEVARIKTMTAEELLDYVLANPEYVSDSYYSDFGRAIYKRHEELRTP